MRKINKGFTTIELIFTLCILAIIFAIIIPVYPKIEQRMKVNVDKRSARNIAEAVSVWFSDYSTDSQLKKKTSFIEDVEALTEAGRKSVSLLEIDGLENYVDVYMTPKSMVDETKVAVPGQKFFVSFIRGNVDTKVVITVGTEGVKISESSIVDYDGNSNGIIYIDNYREG